MEEFNRSFTRGLRIIVVGDVIQSVRGKIKRFGEGRYIIQHAETDDVDPLLAFPFRSPFSIL